MSEGFIPAENPCCGVHAVAEATALPFATVWNVAKFTVMKKASWRGRTTYTERLAILNALSADYSPHQSFVGISLIEAAFLAVSRHCRANFILDISGHSLALINGEFVDQNGSYSPVHYKRRFHYIQHATLVFPVTNFDEDALWESLVRID